MYFLMVRPAQKQQKQQRAMMDALDVGVRVMLGSGIYGTIRHLGEKQAVIEISPGVDLTILRAAIRSVVTPEEEEFEYSDDQAVEADHYEDMVDYEADIASAFGPEEAEDTEETEDSEDTEETEETDQIEDTDQSEENKGA
ncbi:MAG: preprotein translocase subunit YajC [Propionibacteriaceae bacterium]|nr:preprotein translocase subunit YajC [Propionibacteriaceae bacterium]